MREGALSPAHSRSEFSWSEGHSQAGQGSQAACTSKGSSTHEDGATSHWGWCLERGTEWLWVCRWPSPKALHEGNINFPNLKLQIIPNAGKLKDGNPNAIRFVDHDSNFGLLGDVKHMVW